MTFNRQQSRKEFEIKCTLENIVKQLRGHYRKLFWNDERLRKQNEGVSSGGVTPIAAFQKASAWYFVAYTVPYTPYSFPWLTIGDLLIEIFQSKGVDQSMKVTSEISIREWVDKVRKSEEAFAANGKRKKMQQQRARNGRSRGMSNFDIDDILKALKIDMQQ